MGTEIILSGKAEVDSVLKSSQVYYTTVYRLNKAGLKERLEGVRSRYYAHRPAFFHFLAHFFLK